MANDAKSDSYEVALWAKIAIGFMIFLLAAPAYMSGRGAGFFAAPEDETNVEVSDTYENGFSLKQIIGQGDLALGKNVVALGEIQVRQIPGGKILGTQQNLADGKIVEGPVEAFQTIWWRVNFENAPSGWVEYKDITTKIFLTKLIYFPITFYKSYKPIGWILSIVLLIIVLLIKSALSKEQEIIRKKMKVQDEQTEKNRIQNANDYRGELGLPIEDNSYKNPRWEHVLELMKTKNQNDWRQAIIEADIILDEMLRRMGYDGLTIGDMLKTVDPADFATLEKAWSAHKFRNEIAHTGSEFKLSKDEADRVVDLYRSVFDEFYFI